MAVGWWGRDWRMGERLNVVLRCTRERCVYFYAGGGEFTACRKISTAMTRTVKAARSLQSAGPGPRQASGVRSSTASAASLSTSATSRHRFALLSRSDPCAAAAAGRVLVLDGRLGDLTAGWCVCLNGGRWEDGREEVLNVEWG
jgi:hypothetical protein